MCAGGDGFRQILQEESKNLPMYGYCKECVVDHKVESFFCCLDCFAENFQIHRETVHMPKRDKVGEIYEDEDDLEFTSKDEYHARRIQDHWIPVSDAVKQWARNMGASTARVEGHKAANGGD